jgi:hypothetical protein
MSGQVVENHNVAFGKGGRELGLNPDIENLPVHRLIDLKRRSKAIAAQAGDEGLRLPMTEWGLALQP